MSVPPSVALWRTSYSVREVTCLAIIRVNTELKVRLIGGFAMGRIVDHARSMFVKRVTVFLLRQRLAAWYSYSGE